MRKFILGLVFAAALMPAVSEAQERLSGAQTEALRHCGGMERCSRLVRQKPDVAEVVNACFRALNNTGSPVDNDQCDFKVFGYLLPKQLADTTR